MILIKESFVVAYMLHFLKFIPILGHSMAPSKQLFCRNDTELRYDPPRYIYQENRNVNDFIFEFPLAFIFGTLILYAIFTW